MWRRGFGGEVGANFVHYPTGSGIEKISHELRGDHLFDRALGRERARAGSQKTDVLLPNGGAKFQREELEQAQGDGAEHDKAFVGLPTVLYGAEVLSGGRS